MTNYTRLATCISTAQNLAAELSRSSAHPLISHALNAREHVGNDADPMQIAAFEWAWLELAAPEFATYCRSRLSHLLAHEFSREEYERTWASVRVCD